VPRPRRRRRSRPCYGRRRRSARRPRTAIAPPGLSEPHTIPAGRNQCVQAKRYRRWRADRAATSPHMDGKPFPPVRSIGETPEPGSTAAAPCHATVSPGPERQTRPRAERRWLAGPVITKDPRRRRERPAGARPAPRLWRRPQPDGEHGDCATLPPYRSHRGRPARRHRSAKAGRVRPPP